MFVHRTAIAVGFVALLLALGIRNPADAYPVGPSLDLDKLSEQADLVFKAVAVASQPVEDAWFGKVWGFESRAT